MCLCVNLWQIRISPAGPRSTAPRALPSLVLVGAGVAAGEATGEAASKGAGEAVGEALGEAAGEVADGAWAWGVRGSCVSTSAGTSPAGKAAAVASGSTASASLASEATTASVTGSTGTSAAGEVGVVGAGEAASFSFSSLSCLSCGSAGGESGAGAAAATGGEAGGDGCPVAASAGASLDDGGGGEGAPFSSSAVPTPLRWGWPSSRPSVAMAATVSSSPGPSMMPCILPRLQQKHHRRLASFACPRRAGVRDEGAAHTDPGIKTPSQKK